MLKKHSTFLKITLAVLLVVIFIVFFLSTKDISPEQPKDFVTQAEYVLPDMAENSTLDEEFEKIKNKITDDFVGVWQVGSPGMAAGWGARYQFFQSGVYTYQRSQMACADRALANVGKWVLHDGVLILTPVYKDDIVGGQEVDDSLCGRNIQGGVVKRTPYSIQFVGMVTSCSKEEQSFRLCKQVNGIPFYKFSNTPFHVDTGYDLIANEGLLPEPLFK